MDMFNVIYIGLTNLHIRYTHDNDPRLMLDSTQSNIASGRWLFYLKQIKLCLHPPTDCVCGRIPFALLVQQRLLHPLNICVDPCHLWEVISRMWVRGYGRMPYPPTRLLCVPCVLWEDMFALLVQQRLLHPLRLRSPSDRIAFAA